MGKPAFYQRHYRISQYVIVQQMTYRLLLFVPPLMIYISSVIAEARSPKTTGLTLLGVPSPCPTLLWNFHLRRCRLPINDRPVICPSHVLVCCFVEI